MRSTLIVVGVDGSEGGRRALRWAMHEAAHSGAAVEAVNAWSSGGPEGAQAPPGERAGAEERAARTLEREVQAVLDEWVSAPPPLAREVVEGRPAQVLVEAAANAGMLVLGSHGHGRLHHLTLGSVSESCIRQGSCPVVVVPVAHPQRHRRSAEPAVFR